MWIQAVSNYYSSIYGQKKNYFFPIILSIKSAFVTIPIPPGTGVIEYTLNRID